MPSLPVTLLCQYHYDALDRLIANASANAPEQQRFYCKSRLTTEITAAAHCSIVQHLNQLLAQQQDDGNTRDTTLLATDQQRSVLQTLKANHPRHSIAYSPYGHRPAASGLLSLLGFNGERADPVTGYYFLGNGYRVFNPVLMRFISPDRWSPFGRGGINPYAYCLGDPVNRSDPNGKYSKALIELVRISGQVKRNGKLYKYNPAASPKEALKANDKIIKIDKKLQKLQQQDPIQTKFRQDFSKRPTSNTLNPPTTSPQQTTNNFLDDQTNLFNYINSGDSSRPQLNENALISAATQTDRRIIDVHPRINRDLAKEYLDQINRIRNPEIKKLELKKIDLELHYF